MKLFKKKTIEYSSILEKQQKQNAIKKQLDSIFRDKHNKVCKLCENPIATKDVWSKQGGYFWHKSCWNKAKKIAIKQTM